MAYEPLHHKYRPQTFSDLVGQETIALTLSNALSRERIAPAYLFTGPRGTGKTSSARILAKSLNCLNSNKPTPNPCGKCEACLAIAKGSALDVMEIDAASNTGVDNIREIIERSRFAPVQCRYKIYVVDECLTGDSLVQTSEGLMQIDNPDLKGKQVLSYNENTKTWEYKKVLRWLERGTKETLTIKTGSSQISCTANHLIRTETRWIEARNVKEGMKIFSPVSADAERTYTNTELMDEYVDSLEDISSKETNTEQNPIISAKFTHKQKPYSLCANVDVKKNSIFPTFYNKKEEELKVFNHTGTDILIEKVTDSGINEIKTSSILLNNCKSSNLDLSTELYLGMEASNIPTPTVDFLDYAGLMVQSSIDGWSIKQIGYNNYDHKYEMWLIEDMVNNQLFATQSVIPSYKKFIELLSKTTRVNWLPENGCNLLLQKGWHGGTWMMVLSSLVQEVVLPSFFILKGFLKEKIKLLLNGLMTWDTLLTQNSTLENLLKKLTTTLNLELNLVENGYQTYNNIQYPRWNTNLEKVESVSLAGYEKVYDLEVADNHNFVANDLLVHNCHMLSTAAFNALLKTLEEPPPQVVFILATTDPQRVLSTIISRCQRFDYRRIPLEEMTAHLKYIADAEKIAIADDALTLIAQIANGGLRDAESLLDQLSLLPETITVAKVWDLVGAVPEQDLLRLLQAINHNDSLAVLQQCRSLLDRGREPLIVLQNLASFYLNLLIAKTSPRHAELTTVTETCWQQLCSEAANWQTGFILRGQQQLKEAETQLKRTTQPRLWLEVTLLGLLPEAYQAIAPLCEAVSFSAPAASTAKPPQVSPQADISSEQNKNTSAAPPASSQSSPHRSQVESPVESPPKTSVAQSNRDPQTVKAIPASTVPPEIPAAVAPSPHQDPVANQEIWSKVVSCLQPPTTQALLKQQCHLVSFDGLSAIVGISSAKLQKLNQGKVPNIEAAFAQVCQRLVKVQLEVANPKDNPGNDLSFIKQSVIAPPPSSPKQSFAQPLSSNAHNTPTIPPEKELVQPQNSFSQDRTISELSSQSQKTSSTTSHLQAVSFSQDISVLTAPAIPTENNLATPTAELSSNQNYADDDLQRAINNLTQSFEGEVVQFDNNSQAEFLTETELSESEIDLASLERRDANNYDDDW
jgi:DNA polymerase III subunit gamma/tau